MFSKRFPLEVFFCFPSPVGWFLSDIYCKSVDSSITVAHRRFSEMNVFSRPYGYRERKVFKKNRKKRERERESKRDTDNSPPITNFATKLDT